jgi:hypothetical protein
MLFFIVIYVKKKRSRYVSCNYEVGRACNPTCQSLRNMQMNRKTVGVLHVLYVFSIHVNI